MPRCIVPPCRCIVRLLDPAVGLMDIRAVLAHRPMLLTTATLGSHALDHSHAPSASPWVGFALHLGFDLSQEACVSRWCPLRVRKMARSRKAGRRRIPRRCKCQAKRAFARAFLNLLLKVGVILRSNKDDDKVEQPNRHPRIAQCAYRDQCAASSLQRSIEKAVETGTRCQCPKRAEG